VRLWQVLQLFPSRQWCLSVAAEGKVVADRDEGFVRRVREASSEALLLPAAVVLWWRRGEVAEEWALGGGSDVLATDQERRCCSRGLSSDSWQSRVRPREVQPHLTSRPSPCLVTAYSIYGQSRVSETHRTTFIHSPAHQTCLHWSRQFT
jgi:hypothetical protein